MFSQIATVIDTKIYNNKKWILFSCSYNINIHKYVNTNYFYKLLIVCNYY